MVFIYENTFAPLTHYTLDMEASRTSANLIPNTADTNTLEALVCCMFGFAGDRLLNNFSFTYL